MSISQAVPGFFHGPGDDTDCMAKMKKCIMHAFESREVVEKEFGNFIDCRKIRFEMPSWISGGHRMVKQNGKYPEFDYASCQKKKTFTQMYEEHGYVRLASKGYCRTNVNAWLYTGTKDSQYLWECISLCNTDDSCVAFTFDKRKEICEFQCVRFSDLCESPEYPRGNPDTCVTMTDDRDTWSECFTTLRECNKPVFGAKGSKHEKRRYLDPMTPSLEPTLDPSALPSPDPTSEPSLIAQASSHGDPIIWTFFGECYDLRKDGIYRATEFIEEFDEVVDIGIYNDFMREIQVWKFDELLLSINNFGEVIDNGFPSSFEHSTRQCPEELEGLECYGTIEEFTFDVQDFSYAVQIMYHDYNDAALSEGESGLHLDIAPRPYPLFEESKHRYTGLYFGNPLPSELEYCEYE